MSAAARRKDKFDAGVTRTTQKYSFLLWSLCLFLIWSWWDEVKSSMGQGSSDVVLQTDFRTWLDQRSGVVSKLSWLLTSQLGTFGSKVSLVSWKSSRDISTSSRCSDSLISSCRTHSAVQKSLNFEWVHEECKTFVLNVAQWGLVRSTENLVRTNRNVLLWLDVAALVPNNNRYPYSSAQFKGISCQRKYISPVHKIYPHVEELKVLPTS